MNTNPMLYSIVRYQPDASRQEVVNIGVVLFANDGPRIRLAKNLSKVLALDPNASLVQVQNLAGNLVGAIEALLDSGQSATDVFQMLGSARAGVTLTAPGMVERDEQAFEVMLDDLERDLVVTPVKQRVVAPRKSRLHTELRAVFRSAKILGKDPDDISQHKVVPYFPIDADVGLFAEFALRNGRLHVTETVDFRVGDATNKKREAEAKTLVLIQALETVGADELHRYVVVSGASSTVQASMNLLERHVDDLIVRESQQDWLRYVNVIASAARHKDRHVIGH